MDHTRLVMNQFGIDDLSNEFGFDTGVFDDLAASYMPTLQFQDDRIGIEPILRCGAQQTEGYRPN